MVKNTSTEVVQSTDLSASLIFTAYVAYKLVAAAPLAAGTRPRPPDPPPPLTGRVDPEPPRAPAPITDPNDASVIANQALIDAANQRRLAWLDTPVLVRNQSVIDAATAAIERERFVTEQATYN